ncbi:hypothetical protein [Streptomyces sp. NPDC012888]|uniref:hypothetical protein n=1 Tax=Streptomyces sp. NPDC012888 TaxID=3364855 RepID=UPI00367F6BF7
MAITGLQVYAVEDAGPRGGTARVRCLGGVARTGELYAAGDWRTGLRRIERHGRTADRLDAGQSATVHLAGAVVALLTRGQVLTAVPLGGLRLAEAEPWALHGPDAALGLDPDPEGMRALAVSHMQDTALGDEERIRWGRVALAATVRSRREPMDGAAAEARVRAYLIRQFGPLTDATDGLRDPAALCSFVLDRIDRTPAEAVRAARHWRDLELTGILGLRRVKNLTAALEDVVPHLPPGHPLTGPAAAWLTVRRHLP